MLPEKALKELNYMDRVICDFKTIFLIILDKKKPLPLATCSAGYSKVAGCCFHLGRRKLNWVGAAKYCARKGGRLMDVDPYSWHSVLSRYLSSNKSPLRGNLFQSLLQ